MKKILILGGNGFIGKSLSILLNKKYEVHSPGHEGLDATDLNQLQKLFEKHKYDFVVNCALSGEGRLLKQDTPQNFYENLIIQENLLYLSDFYSKLIVFSSGAQEDRTNDVNNLREGQFGPPPNNYYSLAKYINAKRVLGNNKVINLRIFNVFGPLEKPNRFIKSCINKYLNKQDIEIWGDTYFDFFGINDLVTTVEYLIDNPPNKYFEMNLCYFEKYKLSQITSLINFLDNHRVKVKITEGVNKNYFGSGYRLADLGLKLNGLRREIESMYEKLKNEK